MPKKSARRPASQSVEPSALESLARDRQREREAYLQRCQAAAAQDQLRERWDGAWKSFATAVGAWVKLPRPTSKRAMARALCDLAAETKAQGGEQRILRALDLNEQRYKIDETGHKFGRAGLREILVMLGPLGKALQGHNATTIAPLISDEFAGPDLLAWLPSVRQEILNAPYTTTPAEELKSPPGGSYAEPEQSRGVAPRDRKFVEWYNAPGTDTYHKPAKIHAKWEGMTATQRAAICPESPNKITKFAVTMAIKRAVGKKPAKPKRAARKKP